MIRRWKIAPTVFIRYPLPRWVYAYETPHFSLCFCSALSAIIASTNIHLSYTMCIWWGVLIIVCAVAFASIRCFVYFFKFLTKAKRRGFCLSVCLSDDNFRKPWRRKFIYAHSGGATPRRAMSNDLSGRSTALAPPCLLLCCGNSVNRK